MTRQGKAQEKKKENERKKGSGFLRWGIVYKRNRVLRLFVRKKPRSVVILPEEEWMLVSGRSTSFVQCGLSVCPLRENCVLYSLACTAHTSPFALVYIELDQRNEKLFPLFTPRLFPSRIGSHDMATHPRDFSYSIFNIKIIVLCFCAYIVYLKHNFSLLTRSTRYVLRIQIIERESE